jgi:heme/copper-type cytochrome/quinol oxidase subunit 2
MNFNRLAKFTLCLAAFIAATAISAFAQCAMCKANIINAENAAEVSSTMNTAVLALLIPTLLVIGGVIRLVFKYRHSINDNSISPDSYVHFRPSDTQRNPE